MTDYSHAAQMCIGSYKEFREPLNAVSCFSSTTRSFFLFPTNSTKQLGYSPL